MNQKSTATFLLSFILLTAGTFQPWETGNTVTMNDESHRCRFEGLYILEPEGPGVHGLDMAIPIDAQNERVALIHDLADYDATLGGLLPTAVRYTTGNGEAIRVGPRTFAYTLHFWIVDKNNQRLALVTSNGTKVFDATDCNKYETTGGKLSIYFTRQDADNDGFPDEGELPAYCVPYELKAKRISILPSCNPVAPGVTKKN